MIHFSRPIGVIPLVRESDLNGAHESIEEESDEFVKDTYWLADDAVDRVEVIFTV